MRSLPGISQHITMDLSSHRRCRWVDRCSIWALIRECDLGCRLVFIRQVEVTGASIRSVCSSRKVTLIRFIATGKMKVTSKDASWRKERSMEPCFKLRWHRRNRTNKLRCQHQTIYSSSHRLVELNKFKTITCSSTPRLRWWTSINLEGLRLSQSEASRHSQAYKVLYHHSSLSIHLCKIRDLNTHSISLWVSILWCQVQALSRILLATRCNSSLLAHDHNKAPMTRAKWLRRSKCNRCAPGKMSIAVNLKPKWNSTTKKSVVWKKKRSVMKENTTKTWRNTWASKLLSNKKLSCLLHRELFLDWELLHLNFSNSNSNGIRFPPGQMPKRVRSHKLCV